MGSNKCMNELCRATTSSEWKKGWCLKSGAFATLCSNCGSAYEDLVFCETFHSDESGWRECRICRKLVHCGCITSKSLYEYMDYGGIMCQSCAKHMEIRPPVPASVIKIPSDIPNGTFVTSVIKDVRQLENKINDDTKINSEGILRLTNAIRINDVSSTLEQHKRVNDVASTLEQHKRVNDVASALEQHKQVNDVASALEQHKRVNDVASALEQHNRVNGVASALEQHKQVNDVASALEQHKRINDVSSALEQHKRINDVSSALEQHKRVNDVASALEQHKHVNDVASALEQHKQVNDVASLEQHKRVSDVASTLEQHKRVSHVASALELHKRVDPIPKPGESNHPIQNLSQHFPSSLTKTDSIGISKQGVKDMFGTLAQPSLKFSLSSPLGSPKIMQPYPGGIIERSDQSKGPLQPGQKMRINFPKPPKPSPTGAVATPETNKGYASQLRIARPPAEGRGRNQLLPRYWPRITDQELQQLSGDLKSNIVPLFEKILSASDAGRIGRLVLPKACAEAYFPNINQSEGIPIKIQDITGKEWTFQFRFWPNNNSRMYVLEGVTPCIQNMQLQAGDTVIFSRREPGGQLVIGCRKATHAEAQDASTSAVPNGDAQEGKISGAKDNQLTNGGKAPDDPLPHRIPASEKKKARNIKNQRLHMHNDDAMELRITWEEAQELFRPPPSTEPTIVMVDGHEFEEFEEPPVFGKKTIFISRASGVQEQLAQCDRCLKWRRLPYHVLLSSAWTCSDNIWDSKRCSCGAPEEVNPRDLDLSSINHGLKKRRLTDKKDSKAPAEGEPSGLDALATAAVLGDNMSDFPESSVGATTRHPRHRPGCTCIVCIQPPSGKGKHDPACKCNVCLTVKRRFKTLMMRKKKRQSEREAELAQDGKTTDPANKKPTPNGSPMDADQTSQGQKLDLNFDPRREDEQVAEVAAGMGLTSLVDAATATLSLDVDMEKNGAADAEGSQTVEEKTAKEETKDEKDG